jgi:hypothetical protein
VRSGVGLSAASTEMENRNVKRAGMRQRITRVVVVPLIEDRMKERARWVEMIFHAFPRKCRQWKLEEIEEITGVFWEKRRRKPRMHTNAHEFCRADGGEIFRRRAALVEEKCRQWKFKEIVEIIGVFWRKGGFPKGNGNGSSNDGVGQSGANVDCEKKFGFAGQDEARGLNVFFCRLNMFLAGAFFREWWAELGISGTCEGNVDWKALFKATGEKVGFCGKCGIAGVFWWDEVGYREWTRMHTNGCAQRKRIRVRAMAFIRFEHGWSAGGIGATTVALVFRGWWETRTARF